MARTLAWLIVAGAALAGLYWWAAVDNRMPDDARFVLDLAHARRLAASLPGDRPAEIRYEKVAAFAFPRAMIAAGDPWSRVPMEVYAYQVVTPGGTGIIDAAMTRALATPEFMVPFFDDAAALRVDHALTRAGWIAITHEHADHIGGIVRHPQFRALFPALRITGAQLAEPSRMMQARPADDAFAGYDPLHYDRMTAIAPGVVLIAAPGHTPGSQLVFVQRGDGRELLFLGDVAWKLASVEQQRERPRWVTGVLIREDRHAVFGQLKALHALMETEKDLRLVPGHDGGVIEALTADGSLTAGFAP